MHALIPPSAVRAARRLVAVAAAAVSLAACVTFSPDQPDPQLQAYAQGAAFAEGYGAPPEPGYADEAPIVRRETSADVVRAERGREVETSSLDEPAPPPRRTAPPKPVVKDSDYHRTYGVSAAEEPPEFVEPEPQPEGSAFGGLSRIDGTADAAPAPRPRPAAAAPGRVHRVRNGEQLADVAAAHDVSEVKLIEANGLRPPYRLKDGQSLVIPAAGTPVASAASADPVPGRKPVTRPAAPQPQADPPAAETRETGVAFDWPLSGKIVAKFGSKSKGLYNDGINIAAARGTPIKASAAGVVRYAGDELKGYGNLILIEHAGGFVTAYAHAQDLMVRRGDKVARGRRSPPSARPARSPRRSCISRSARGRRRSIRWAISRRRADPRSGRRGGRRNRA